MYGSSGNTAEVFGQLPICHLLLDRHSALSLMSSYEHSTHTLSAHSVLRLHISTAHSPAPISKRLGPGNSNPAPLLFFCPFFSTISTISHVTLSSRCLRLPRIHTSCCCQAVQTWQDSHSGHRHLLHSVQQPYMAVSRSFTSHVLCLIGVRGAKSRQSTGRR